MKPRSIALSAAALVTLAGCAGAPDQQPPAADPDQLYAVWTTVLQAPGSEPQLCLGGVMESYPPQCGGPTAIGLDWDDVADVERASGTTWGTGWFVGTYDSEASALTLTAPVAEAPPTGAEGSDPVVVGGGGAAAAPEDLDAAQDALHTDLRTVVLTSSADPAGGVLEVGVALADEPTVAAVREVVSPWLAADQVVVTGALIPLA